MKQAQHGFTIVEVMMFLAISGVMFTIAFWGTQKTQDSVRFRDSLNSTEAKIREVFDNVDDGYFANSGNYDCDPSRADDWVQPNLLGGGNSECVFIGKRLYFSSSKTMIIETILGNRHCVTCQATSASLKEDYQLKNSVQYTGATGASLRIEAIRDTGASGSYMRAARRVSTGGSFESFNSVILCFSLGDKLGSVTVLPNDVTVQYSRTTCP